jgi:alkylation response protein AidB-like acyl-CoA dehydrogenase
MEFEDRRTYTPEQEAFRKEVRAWLEENPPPRPNLQGIEDEAEVQRLRALMATGREMREWRRKLGAKGWIEPTAPPQLGGAGLSRELAMVLVEEFERVGVNVGAGWLPAAIIVHGTEEQKQRFVVPLYRGEITVGQAYTEPEAGSDLASLKTKAIRDGDEWVITGSKQFISINPQNMPDYLATLAVTDPLAPRHENLGYFMVPGNAPGITVQPMDLITMQEYGGGQNFVFFDNVRVPAENVISAPNKGWQVANTVLELEHGAIGNIGGRRTYTGGAMGANFTYTMRALDYLKEEKQRAKGNS